MKNIFLSSLLMIFSFAPCHAGFQEQFAAQWDQKDIHGMEKTLKDWRHADPGDEELLVASGDFFYVKARRQARGHTQPLPEGSPPVVRIHSCQEDADPPGNPSDWNRSLLTQAVTCWQSALALQPFRLDLYFHLADAFQRLGDFESQYGVLAQGLQYADRNRKALMWSGDGKLPKRSRRLIPEWVHSTVAYYLGLGDSKSIERTKRLARLTITFYPGHPYAYNSLAACYAANEDWPYTLKYLLLASRQAPRDSLVLCNIGNVLARLGKRKGAKVFYGKVVELNRDPESVRIADDYLKKRRHPLPTPGGKP